MAAGQLGRGMEDGMGAEVAGRYVAWGIIVTAGTWTADWGVEAGTSTK
jgi:hypothetical protein